MQLWALVADSFRQALDRKLFWVLVVITLLVTLFMLSVGFEGEQATLFFGLVQVDSGEYAPLTLLGRTRLAGLIVYGAMDLVLGWVGITLVVIATAGTFPALMEPGAIDVVLSKPISRSRLFLYKYLASMVFVLVQATLFIGLTFLVMGFRWDVWVPGYLLSIPLLVLMFSYVYCVSVLVAVRTRSTVTAILVSLAAWAIFSVAGQMPGVFEVFPDLKKYEGLHRAVRVVSWVPPKTADVTYLAARWAQAGTSVDMMPDSSKPSAATQRKPKGPNPDLKRARTWEEEQLQMSPAFSIGSSLLFEAAVVMLALRRFARTDF
jgi:ABC-type transport system involved in multi-copper enzyme maturation permease subunit